jgi:hypothetical protein
MTIEEEAIEILDTLSAEYYPNAPEKEALDLAIKALEHEISIKDWLSTFNTDSATECFTAVQQLKERVNE